MHGTGIVGDEKEAIIECDARQARNVACPHEIAAHDFEARDPALEGDGANLAFLDHRKRRDVGDALQLRRALRRRNVAFPADVAGRHVHGQQLAARSAREETAAACRAAGVIANRERRVGALIHPFRLAVGGCNPMGAPVARPDHDGAVRDAGRSQHLAGHSRLPQRLAVRVESEDIPLVGADDHERCVRTHTCRQLASGLGSPDDRAARRIDAKNRPANVRRIDRIRRNRRREAGSRAADVDLPHDLRVRRDREIRKGGHLLSAAEHRGEPAE